MAVTSVTAFINNSSYFSTAVYSTNFGVFYRLEKEKNQFKVEIDDLNVRIDHIGKAKVNISLLPYNYLTQKKPNEATKYT